MKIGFLGAGDTVAIANLHAAAFKRLPQTTITAVFDINRNYAEAFLQRHDLDIRICDSYEQLLDKVDAVCICTPNQTHALLATKALVQGKAVICEKPLGGSPDELSALRAEASSQNAPLNMTAYVCRHMPSFMKMRDIVASGGIGEPYYFVQQRGGNRLSNANVPFEWRMDASTNGGAIADYGAHALDIFLFIAGLNPDDIESAVADSGIVIPFRQKGNERIAVTSDDLGTAVFRFRNNKQATILGSRVGYPMGFTEIVGSKGMLLFTDDKPLELRYWTKTAEDKMSTEPQIITLDEDNSYFHQIRYFVNSWEKGEKAEPSLAYGVDLLQKLNMSYLSIKTGQKVYAKS